MEEKIRKTIERFWNDVTGLPWKDAGWVNNKALREQTRQHFVNATVEDLMLLIGQEELIKEDKNATDSSNDQE